MNKPEIFNNCKINKKQFLKEYWHKKPLLIKNAINAESVKGFFPDKETLIQLSCNEDIQSRIVFKNSDTDYDVEYGPFIENEFSDISETTWNLLVSDIDKWHPESNQILKYFDFIRNWIFDDIMLSCGSVGGTVGPHTDHYDVFLLQVSGERLWKFNTEHIINPDLIKGAELKLMSDFKSDIEYNLQPGDILYLPPEIAHYGIITSDDCITCSIGMRTPSVSELLVSYVDNLSQTLSGDKRFVEPSFDTQPQKGEITESDISNIAGILQQHFKVNHTDLLSWFGKYITEYRSLFYEFNQYQQRDNINKSVNLKLSPISKACYFRNKNNANLFVNGKMYSCSLQLATQICDTKSIPVESYKRYVTNELEIIAELFENGSLTQ